MRSKNRKALQRRVGLIKGLIQEPWKAEWQGMPEFIQNDLKAFKTILVHFKTKEDQDAFSKLVGQNISERTPYIWFPEKKRERLLEKIYKSES